MTWNNKVVWSAGMFLQPQHFQQQDRYVEALVEARTRAIAPHHYGFVSLVIDDAALALGKISLASAHGVLPDGTPFEFPGMYDAPLPLDVAPDTKTELIYLALPVRRPGSLESDAGAAVDASLARYTAQALDTIDNTATDTTALIQVGRLRLRLMRGSEATDAYARIGVARVVERRPDNQLVLDPAYIGPALSTAGNRTLAGYTQELRAMLHQRGEALAARLGQPGRGGVSEIADFLFLQTINRFSPVFAHLADSAMLHPAHLFEVCLMLAGDLSTFGRENRRPIDFPRYRHDDLENTFRPLVADLRRSLSVVLEPNAVPIELQDRKYGVRVGMIPDLGLVKSAGFVLAVSAQMPADVLRVRFPSQVKVGPVEKIRDLVNLALPGIALNALSVAPRQIPYHAGFTYFELDKSGEMWALLERTGGLAMHIAGDFPKLSLELWAIKG